ncbi:Flagellar FliJ protein [anaerobic digester metagenome]
MARPFIFKLEKVLEFRTQLEDQAKLALSKALQDLQEQAVRVEGLERDLAACQEEMSRIKQMTQPELWLWSGWRNRLELDKKQAQAKLAVLERLVEERRLDLVAKAKDRKLLEKLRAKQAVRHGQEEQRKEQSAFDETATLRHGRAPY